VHGARGPFSNVSELFIFEVFTGLQHKAPMENLAVLSGVAGSRGLSVLSPLYFNQAIERCRNFDHTFRWCHDANETAATAMPENDLWFIVNVLKRPLPKSWSSRSSTTTSFTTASWRNLQPFPALPATDHKGRSHALRVELRFPHDQNWQSCTTLLQEKAIRLIEI
jgi:hypothetical protein